MSLTLQLVFYSLFSNPLGSCLKCSIVVQVFQSLNASPYVTNNSNDNRCLDLVDSVGVKSTDD